MYLEVGEGGEDVVQAGGQAHVLRADVSALQVGATPLRAEALLDSAQAPLQLLHGQLVAASWRAQVVQEGVPQTVHIPVQPRYTASENFQAEGGRALQGGDAIAPRHSGSCTDSTARLQDGDTQLQELTVVADTAPLCCHRFQPLLCECLIVIL